MCIYIDYVCRIVEKMMSAYMHIVIPIAFAVSLLLAKIFIPVLSEQRID